MNTFEFYHEPVLRDAVTGLLITDRHGIYVDCTLGGGGHFRALSEHLLPGSIIIGIDRDPDALAFNRKFEVSSNTRQIFAQSRFSQFDEVLNKYNITGVTGILLDLGVSSFQIDREERGFSYMRESNLDMRMNPAEGITASELIADIDEDGLAEILSKYGEIQNSSRMAAAIKKYEKPIHTSTDLRNCLYAEYGPNLQIKVISRVFQALRIAVNDELGELETFLSKVTPYLVSGGRVAVISYHSLEDRMVKEFFKEQEKSCTCPGDALYCTCKKQVLLKRVTKKALKADVSEIKQNPRARSARLRVAQRTGVGGE